MDISVLSFILHLVVLCAIIALYRRIRINEGILRSLSNAASMRQRLPNAQALRGPGPSTGEVEQVAPVTLSAFARATVSSENDDDHTYMSMVDIHQSNETPPAPPNSLSTEATNSFNDLYGFYPSWQ